MGKISEWFGTLPVGALILSFVLAFNVAITGLSKALDMIKDKTKTDLDNKISAVIHKIADFLQKMLDFVGYNPAH